VEGNEKIPYIGLCIIYKDNGGENINLEKGR
jgi:hypothetical protein